MAQASDFERWLGDFEGGKLRGLHSTANGILKVARLLFSGGTAFLRGLSLWLRQRNRHVASHVDHNKIYFECSVEVIQLGQLILPSSALRAKLVEVRIFEGRKSLTWTMTL